MFSISLTSGTILLCLTISSVFNRSNVSHSFTLIPTKRANHKKITKRWKNDSTQHDLCSSKVITRTVSTTSIRRTTLSMTQQSQTQPQFKYKHALAILSMPISSIDRIMNEAVIETVLPTTNKLSIVVRCINGIQPTTVELRRYVGEIYSQLWDVALSADNYNAIQNPDLPDVVIYPQNLYNVAPESWIDISSDLDCICSHDCTVGWTSETATTTSSTTTTTTTTRTKGKRYEQISGKGIGGLDDHVNNVNRERQLRQLSSNVVALHVPEPNVISNILDNEISKEYVTFLDDDDEYDNGNGDNDNQNNNEGREGGLSSSSVFISGAVPSKQQHVYNNVCCGGTFDGLHFGHRKLLTLAVSSVVPLTGSLLVGVTVDKMLQKKAFYEQIPSFDVRCQGVKDFLHRLAPGMINRIQVVPILDVFGPPGQKDTAHHFDALVLSHETLSTGYKLNEHRINELHVPPLQLLCTRRTESHGMSSTALRRLRLQRQMAEKEVAEKAESLLS